MSKPRTKGRTLAAPKESVEVDGHVFRVDFNALADFEETVGQPLQEVFRAGRIAKRFGIAQIRAMAYAFCADFATKEDAGAWIAGQDLSEVAEALLEAVARSGYLASGDEEGEA